MVTQPRLGLELTRLRRHRRPQWRLRLRAVVLLLAGYAFLARWPLLMVSPFTVGFWLTIADPSVPATLPPVMTALTILLVFGIGRMHFRRLPFGRIAPTDGWVVVDPTSPLALLAEDVRATMGARAVDRVVITETLTASLLRTVYRSRVRERTLVLGTTLTEVLDIEQLRSVVAHELAHNGRSLLVDIGIHRTSAEWEQLTHDVAATARTAPLLRRFLGWWAPKLVATTIALAQAEELACDRRAAEATSASVVREALIRISLAESMLMRNEQLDGGSSLAALFEHWLASKDADRVLQDVLATPDWHFGDHPPLQARLRALATDWPATIASSGPAAVAVLNDPLLDEAQAQMTEWLAERHRIVAAPPEELDVHELAWRAVSIADDQPEVAVELLERAVQSETRQAWWLAELGRLRLAREDRTGLDSLEEAMRIDPMLTATCCRTAASALDEHDPPVAAAYESRAAEEEAILAEFYAERDTVSAGDDFVEHDLDDEIVGQMAATIRACEGCEEAHIVKKALRVRPEIAPVYLVVVKPRRPPWWQLEHDDAHVRLQERLLASLDVRANLFVLGRKASDPIWKRVRMEPWCEVPIRTPAAVPAGSST